MKIKVRKETETVVHTIYTCPFCNKESQTKAKIERCMKIHEESKLNIGDVIEFYCDNREIGIIESITFDEIGNIKYITDAIAKEISVSDIKRLVMTNEEREKQFQNLLDALRTLPNKLKHGIRLDWAVCRSNIPECYEIIGIPIHISKQ